jgi:glutathione S-transferase
MTATYRLFGAETSAYSTKMRSFLAYKGVAYDWMPRNQDNEEQLNTLSRFPTLPVLVTASGFAVHDTTPMMEALEADSPEPSALPADPSLAFLVSVLEEYADSWLSKAVYHYRWTRKKDQRLAAQRAVDEYYTQGAPEDRKAVEDRAIVRMLDQLRSVGLEGEFGAALEKSFKRFIKLLDDHLKKHLCLFGGRPSVADFAIAGQLIQMMKDPTPAKIIEKDGEFVAKWCEFMAAPTATGPFAALADLSETLAPIFSDELAVAFLPWAAENLENSLAGNDTFEITLGKEQYTLAPLRSSARSFRELRRKFVGGQEIAELRAFTDAANITMPLMRPQDAERLARQQAAEAGGGAVVESEGVVEATPVAETDAVAVEAVAVEPVEKPARRRRKREEEPAAEAPVEAAVTEDAVEAAPAVAEAAPEAVVEAAAPEAPAEPGVPGDTPADVETAAAPEVVSEAEREPPTA